MEHQLENHLVFDGKSLCFSGTLPIFNRKYIFMVDFPAGHLIFRGGTCLKELPFPQNVQISGRF